MTPYSLDGVIYDDDDNTITEPQLRDLLANSPTYLEQQAQEQAAAERAALLAAPLTPPAIEGDTVAEVRASAEAAVADLAQQMTERLSLLGGV
jgi:hypothetical protein